MDNIQNLILLDVKTKQDKYSNYIVMTFTFKLKKLPKDMFLLNDLANQKIKEILCFDFYDLGGSRWADCSCKTIEKSIMFTITDKVVYKDE